MKNLIYAGVIGVCVLVAVVVFVKTRGGGDSSLGTLDDTQMTWVKCLKCGHSSEMSLKQYYIDVREKSAASTTPVLGPMPLTCEKCGKDNVFRAFKCEKCSEVFRAGSVQNDLEDRCPKCKHSATEARRKANQAAQ